MTERVAKIRRQLWQEERERLLDEPAMQGSYHVKELRNLSKRYGDGLLPLIEVCELEKGEKKRDADGNVIRYPLDWVEDYKHIRIGKKIIKAKELPINPQILDECYFEESRLIQHHYPADNVKMYNREGVHIKGREKHSG